ncbi:MAG TPA: hypothetical protein VKW78_21580 [Terriglobales bacterium]|nr:hypothetical protein [Terriglobales bacterium]
MALIKPYRKNTPIRAGTRIDLFCLSCWRVWKAKVEEEYKNTSDFNKRNQLVCPWCRCKPSRAAMAADAKIMTNGGI